MITGLNRTGHDTGYADTDHTRYTPYPSAPPAFGLTGPPAPRPSRAGSWPAVVLASVLVVASGLVAVVLARGPGPAPPPPVAPPPSPVQVMVDAQVRADAAAVEPLVDRWVPQLYASGPEAALAGLQAVRVRYPDAVLVASSDFRSFARPGLYVVVSPTPFATSAEALAWCTARGLGRNGCYAKRLSRTAGPEGSTAFPG